MSTTPEESSAMILIKTSNLHFNENETPYCLYVTIRKKFFKAPSPSAPADQQQVLLDREVLWENTSLRENLQRLEYELLEVSGIMDTTSDNL